MEDLQLLIEKCTLNDRLSQEKLYRRFYPALFLLCKRLLADNRDALETLNDGMIKVFKNIGEYQAQKGDFFNWAYTVVRNTALDKIKRTQQPLIKELSSIVEIAPDENPLRALEGKDIYKLLDALPPATRVVCSLFYIEKFSIKEIREKLALSDGTIKWHLSESRKRIKPVLEKYYL